MGTPHISTLHRSAPDESGVWRARFAGRLACSDARGATCRRSLTSPNACLASTRDCETHDCGSTHQTPQGESIWDRCVLARRGGRISSRVIGAAPREAIARGFWRYDAERASLRWVAG